MGTLHFIGNIWRLSAFIEANPRSAAEATCTFSAEIYIDYFSELLIQGLWIPHLKKKKKKKIEKEKKNNFTIELSIFLNI